MTTDIMTQIDVAQTTGFVAIELWFDHIDDFVNSGKGSVDDIRQALDDNGLAVPTCIYLGDWFDTEGEAYSKAMENAPKAPKGARELNMSYKLNFHRAPNEALPEL